MIVGHPLRLGRPIGPRKASSVTKLVVETWKKRRAEIPNEIEQWFNGGDRVYGVLLQYFPLPFKSGRQDRIGTFFLLAVTESLRKTTRTRQPKYRIALELLNTIRGSSTSVTPDEVRRAKERVRQLKNRQRTWKTNLRAIERSFSF